MNINKIIGEYIFYKESTKGIPHEILFDMLKDENQAFELRISALGWYCKKNKIKQEKLTLKEFKKKLFKNGVTDEMLEKFVKKL